MIACIRRNGITTYCGLAVVDANFYFTDAEYASKAYAKASGGRLRCCPACIDGYRLVKAQEAAAR